MTGPTEDNSRKPGFWRRFLPGKKAPPVPLSEQLMADHLRQMLPRLYNVDTTGMTFEEMKAKHTALLTPSGDEPTIKDLLKWLKRQGPAEWHRSAATWNWDFDLEPMQWIIRQPGCDAGTAVTLFARGEPDYFSRFASMEELEADAWYEMDDVRFLREICERWETGQYSDWRFRPDQLPHLKPDIMPWPVPLTLARAQANGEALDLTGWNEGFPPEMVGRR